MDLRLERARHRKLLAPFSFAAVVIAACVLGVQFMVPDGSVGTALVVSILLLLLVGAMWFSYLRPTICLDGSVIRKTYVFPFPTTYDLDTIEGIRVIGDSNGGVVMQLCWQNNATHLTLQLLRNDNANGMHALPSDVFDALADALDIVDLREPAGDGVAWPKQATTAHVERVLNSAQLNAAGVEGRTAVVELLRSQAAFMKQRDVIESSPLAAHRFTSALIAAALATGLAGPALVQESTE